jgi:hypothetical protein
MNLSATKICLLSIAAALLPSLSIGQTVVRSVTADSTWNDTVIAPQCTLTATPTSISVGETSAVVIAGCGAPTNPANQYRWTVTNSGPTASGTGATYTFPTAGTFCYTVRGASVDGWGKVSPQACVTVTAVTVTATCPTPTSGTATCPSGGTYDYGTNYGPAPTCAVIPWDNYLTACQLTTTCVFPQVPNETNTACICTNGGTGASCTLPLTCTLPQVPNETNTACICTNGGTGASCTLPLTCTLPQVPNETNTACICTNGGTGASCTLPLTCTLPQVPNETNTACICTNGGTGASCTLTPVLTCTAPQVPNVTNTACICTNGGTGASCTLTPVLTCTAPQVPNVTNTACICTNGGTGPSCLITPNATMIAACYWDSTYSASCAHQTFTVTCDSGLDVSANYGSSSGSDLQWGVSATSTTRVIGIGCP